MRAGQLTRRFVLVTSTAVMLAAGAVKTDSPGDEGQGGESGVVAHPSVVDVGRVPTCSTFHWTLRLINTGADPRRVERVVRRGECGATKIPGIARDYLLQTRTPLELKIPQRTSVFPGPVSEKIFVLIEDHPRLEVQMIGESVSSVTVESPCISPNNADDGRVVVRSRDGQPFRILRILPPFIDPPEGASAEHALVIDWDRWREANRPSSFALETDHPLCPWTLGWIGSGAPVPPVPWDEADTEWDAPVFIVPRAFDLGEIPTSTRRWLTGYLVNAGDEPRHAQGPKVMGCDCTKFPDGKEILPGQAIRVQWPVNSGLTSREIRQRFNPGVDAQYRLSFEIRASVISYVVIEPLGIDFYEDPEPCIRVYSVDGQPFRITSIFPLICDELPREAAVEHFLHLDWQRWCETKHQRRMLITTDHPLCRRAYARLNCGGRFRDESIP